MSSYVANFARTGDPNGGALTEWPAHDASSVNIIEFGDTAQPYTGMTAVQTAFWKSYWAAAFGR